MNRHSDASAERTLLVFNCHEPWVYQLGVLGYALDIVVGLKGKYNKGWDYCMRPLPAHARLITLSQAIQSSKDYYCIITHNTTDLLDVRLRPEPRLLVLHHTLEGRLREEQSTIDPQKMKDMLHYYVELVGGHVVATSMFKGESWGFTDDIVHFGIDVSEYLPHRGDMAAGLRICNFVSSRRKILLWDLHEQAFTGLPVTLVGHNPDRPGVQAARDWDHLKMILQAHRFYIHTADPTLEAGHNMASAEAMAAGLPVIGNCHPTSPIRHGVCGFLSDDPQKLRSYARMLLEDPSLARLMGQQARKTVAERFSLTRFKHAFLRSIEIARRKWYTRKIDPASTAGNLDSRYSNCEMAAPV
ncbi:MAG: glycosyltransferase family 4 protein [Sedimentisphaerales bacterium]|nr:glycosyltransferase family 4 protein [Sedimentisphaerales bacterium]